MSVNILDLVKGAVSDQVMGKIGGLLGQSDSAKTSSMFDTAVQSILGGMMKKASTPSGAQDIFGAIQKQDDGMMDKLGDLLGGGREAEFQKSGSGVLDMVFGNDRGGMMGAVAKFLGLDDSMMGKLMMMAAPIVLGAIGKHVKSKALDAVGLGSLLGEQKQHLASSMPAGLTNSLGLSNFMSGASDVVKGAGSAVTGAVSGAGDAVGSAGSAVAGMAGDAGRSAANTAGQAAGAGGSLIKFLLPLILLGALAFFGYKFLMGGGINAAGDAVGDAAGSMVDGAKDMASGAQDKLGGMVGMPDLEGIDFGGVDMMGLKDKFTDISSGVAGVSADSAGGLVGKITDLTGSIEGMGIGDLTGPAKTAAGGVIGSFIESIKAAIDGITDDGILSTLKPAINGLIEKLEGFIH